MPDPLIRKLAGAEMRIADTIINGMRAQTIGRALGIGLRLAGRMAGQSIAGPPQPPQPRTVGAASVSGSSNRARGQDAARTAVQVGKGVQQGVGGFFRPFKRVGGILWLEVTGFFFLLFALVFGWYMWQSFTTHMPHAWDRNATISCAFMAVFLYLGVSSFWRASRR
jgi:hypothetical protein